MIRRRVQPPVEMPPARPMENPSPPSPNETIVGVSELMLTSLPPMMSGADVYVRQFYRGNQLPFRRYLPLRGL